MTFIILPAFPPEDGRRQVTFHRDSELGRSTPAEEPRNQRVNPI
jgi:hypothetical protein